MANNELAITNFKSVINSASIRNRVTACLGENAGAFVSSMLDLYTGDNYLQNCNPEAVAMECLKAASLKLPINKSLGFAYVVPYKNVPTFMIGWRGLVQLAMRTGQYKTINAGCIYEGECVKHNRLTGQFEITGIATSDIAIGYFGYFQLINSYEKMLYMTKQEVASYGRKYSKAFDSSYSPWKTEFDKMAMKTVLRQLLKYGPMSTEMQEAEKMDVLSAETAAKAEIQQNANIGVVIDVPTVDPDTGEVIPDGN